jgi:hypothetical protein
MLFGDCGDESQRDSGLKPKVARNELPWEEWRNTIPSGLQNVDFPSLPSEVRFGRNFRNALERLRFGKNLDGSTPMIYVSLRLIGG